MIGSTVDKYEVLQKLGEGGMATVYRGRHTTLERDVAIKVLHPHLSSSERNRKRFAREARAIEHLRHENILEIFDYSGIENQDCYIITEFVDGQTLTSLLEARGRLPSEVVALIGIELARALGYAHHSGVLHRDLKPDNVMVRDDGTVKLMDFGIARFLDESQVTLTGALVGSPAFMSPEQAIEAELGPRSDLFSLGTMLFYLVTGQLPFTGSNPSLILKKVIEGERPHVSELAPAISPTLCDAIERLMSTHPEARFDSGAKAAEAFVASLEEVRIDPVAPAWSIRAYLSDPDGYEERLGATVSDTLLDEGKAYIARGDALSALRLFNRILSIDEENEEVMELIQTLHAEPEAPRTQRSITPWVVLGLVVLLVGVGLYVWMSPTEPPPAPTTPVELTPPAPVEPSDPIPTPPPLPLGPKQGPALPPTLLSPPSPRRPLPFAQPQPQPAPAPEPVPTEPAPRSAQGTIRLQSRIPADVYLEGKRIGSTRLPITLDAGSYELELRSDVILPRLVRVEIAPGEVVQREVMVETRPARVRLAKTFADECLVGLDGRQLGTVTSLGRAVSVPSPEQVGHQLTIQCPDVPPFEHVWSTVVLPGDIIRP